MINSKIIEQITGEFGVVEIINSGSVFELPVFVLESIRSAVNHHRVHTLYFEAFYAYHKRLDEMRIFFLTKKCVIELVSKRLMMTLEKYIKKYLFPQRIFLS
ncbi:MAG: hypothetical protein LRY69_07945 [Gammaproteobacteria bacterium]|nr:hypothetical protein [Gammaproteobacteria bacterium]